MTKARNHLFLILLCVLIIGCNDNQKNANNNTTTTPTTEEIKDPEEKKFVEPKKHFQLAFGSCNKHSRKQVLWDDVTSLNPEAWIWLGDIIYGDTDDMQTLQKKYAQQLYSIPYQRMKKYVDIYGIWDDHDYGQNDAGADYKMKKESRDILFSFLELPKSNQAWQREGAYQSHVFNTLDFKLKLILLDSRYFREQPTKNGKTYTKEYGPDILGEEQWDWLAKELNDPSVEFFIIGNGIQVISEEHNFEKWANFPSSRDRLFELIQNTENGKVILLSGDRHISELSAIQLDGLDYPLYDLTSSGLTHPWKNFPGEENQHRIGDVINKKNFGILHFSRNEENQIKVNYQIWGDQLEKMQELELF